ncbi:MAG TPA: homocysteine S-methyltransferase family protein [Thermoanaerobaculia bacterium]|nr:homocysteine S-methyltransferase family protein [Thermoanaerobaculia bacterium]
MNAFAERLRRRETTLLDGGLGSLLIARGLGGGEAPESWVLSRPDDVRRAHGDYVGAGSDAVHTATFGANAIRLARSSLADRCEALNAEAVRLARESGARFVLADVGPTGEYLPPVGTGDRRSWKEAFVRQGRALAAAAPDALHVETMTDLREALIALEALKESASSLPVMVSLTFERKKRGFFTIMGDALAGSLRSLGEAGADAVGANCTLASADMRLLAEESRAAVGLPLVIQPNAGAPEMQGGAVFYSQAPEAFAEEMARVASLGVELVGGCCGTDPRFIRALARRLHSKESRP